MSPVRGSGWYKRPYKVIDTGPFGDRRVRSFHWRGAALEQARRWGGTFIDTTQEDPVKKDEKLTKEHGQPVVKGVMESEDLDIGETTNIDPPEEPLDKPKVYDVRTKTYVDIDIPK